MTVGEELERAATVDAVARVLAGERAEHVVPATLASLPHLDNDGRARVAKRVYGVCVLRLRLAALHESLFHRAPLDAADYLDAYLVDEKGESVDVAWPSDRIERIALERSCPRPLVLALVESLGVDGADAFLAASNVPGPRALRANTLRVTRDELAVRLRDEGIATSPGRAAAGALVVEGRANLFGARAWREGLFEVQDEGSQLVVELAPPRAYNAVVVDYCAGRGGKTLALAARMHDTGALHVHDVDDAALKDMKPRLKRAGVTNVVWGLPEAADLVLVDAPCSSVGTLRRSPDLRFHLDVDAALPAHAREQRAILAQAARLVTPGGRLVYATCSVLRPENDAVVDAFLAGGGFVEERRRLLLPHVDGTDGFFICVMTRDPAGST